LYNHVSSHFTTQLTVCHFTTQLTAAIFTMQSNVAILPCRRPLPKSLPMPSGEKISAVNHWIVASLFIDDEKIAKVFIAS
jgi:hypothetical protein